MTFSIKSLCFVCTFILSQVLYTTSYIFPINTKGVYAIIAIPICYFVYFHSVSINDIKKISSFIFLFISAFVVIPIGFRGWGSAPSTTLLFVSSICSAILLFRVTKETSPKLIYRLCCSFLISFALLTLFELYLPPVANLFTYLRSVLYPDFSYSGAMRDQTLLGGARSLLVFAEPSHCAFLINALILLLFLTKQKEFSHKTYIISFISLVLTTATVKSPIAAIGYILIVYLYFYENRKLILHQLTTVKLASLIIVVSLVIFYFFYKQSARITNIVNGHDFSATARINMPLIVTQEVLHNHFIWGVGLGRGDRLITYIKKSFISLGFKGRLSDFNNERLEKLVTNAFALNFIYNGVFGGLLMLLLVSRLFEINCSKRIFKIAIPFLLILLTTGAYVGVKIWALLALLAGADRSINLISAKSSYTLEK